MGSRPIDYDHNYMDGSPVVGVHPILSNVFMATGFNGRGAMYAPGVGRALTELMLGKDDRPWNFFIFVLPSVLRIRIRRIRLF
jgi:FAD-dependent oxidoreductase domain-containing protein 1